MAKSNNRTIMKFKLILIPVLVILMTACMTENVDLTPDAASASKAQSSTVQARTGLPLLTKEGLSKDPDFLNLVNNYEEAAYVAEHAASVFADYSVEGLSEEEIRTIVMEAPQLAFDEGYINSIPLQCPWECASNYATCLLTAPANVNCWGIYQDCLVSCKNGGPIGNGPTPIY